MLKRVPLFVGLLLITGSPLNAQVAIDVAKINCQQFATYKVANPDRIAIWLNGYFHGKRGDMIVDTQELAESADKVKEYCIKNPELLLMQAVETLFGPRN
jgi:acid stress chaperone HdeB